MSTTMLLGVPIDRQYAATAARNCLAYGYAHQAGKLAALDRVDDLIGDDVLVPLRCLAARAAL